MSKTIATTDSTDLMRAAGTARGTKAIPRRRPHFLLGMVLLIGWIFSGAAVFAQVPGAPAVTVAPYYSPLTGVRNSYGFIVSWTPPVSSGGGAITEYKISAKVSPTASNTNAAAKSAGEVTTEFTGIPSSATSKLIVLSSLGNFDPSLASISDSFTCTVSVYAKNASGYGSAGSVVSSAPADGVYVGSGVSVPGFKDATGSLARFNGVSGLAVDSTSTYMYVSDQWNHLIRKVDMTTRAVTTLAGAKPNVYEEPTDGSTLAPTGGFADSSTGATAKFNNPGDVAIAYTGRYSNGGAGMLIVADSANNLIRAVDLTTGATTTIAGGYNIDGNSFGYAGDGGAATAASLYHPTGVAVDSKGNIYIADAWNRVIRKINSSDGIIQTIAGGTNNQANTAGVAIWYFDDFGDYQVTYADYAGDGGPASLATLSWPTKLMFDANDNLYFSDTGNNLVRRIDAATQIITTVAGLPPSIPWTAVNSEGSLVGVSRGDGDLSTYANLAYPGALYVNRSEQEVMIGEIFNLRVMDISSPGNGRIASDQYRAGNGGSYAWSCVMLQNSLSAIAADNPGGRPSVYFLAGSSGIYYENVASQRHLNYSLAPIPSLSFARGASASVQVGATLANAATSSLSGSSSGAISYTSSNPSIATVNSATGIVTGVAAGTVTITATQAASSDTRTNDTASKTYALTVTAVVPSVASPTSASVGLTSATLGGTVTATGGVNLSARGVVYARTSDNSSPKIGGAGVTKVVAGTTATGAFTISATGLSQGTTYSYAAYATNSVGTAYTSAGTFTTTLPTPTLSFATATPASIVVGATFANVATSNLSGVGNGAISYTSSHASIATVDVATGRVTAVGAGTVTITATQAAAAGFNNQASQSYTLTVDLDFTSTDSGTAVTITGYRGESGAVPIPGTIGGHLVTGIAQGAFANCTSITSVTIPASVTSIGKGAFAGCTLLQTFSVDAANASFSSLGGVLFDKTQGILIQYPAGKTAPGYTVPDSVTSIGFGAFSGCVSLKNVTIPDSVTRIGQGAFADCSGLTSATIGTGVAAIEADAFARCVSLPSVLIPGVATLGANAFPEGTTVRRYYTDAQLATRDGEQYAAGQTAGRADVTTAPNTYSLFTVGQIQNVSVGNLVLTRNADGSFTLNYDLEQSTDLVNWTRFQSDAVPLSGLPADKAFVRVRAK